MEDTVNKVVREFNVELDSKKRITIRGEVRATHYHVTVFTNGVILMEPRELKIPAYISEKSLQMLRTSLESIDDDIQGKPVDKAIGFPKLYIVKSTREGVDPPVERQVIDIVEDVSFSIYVDGQILDKRTPSDRYVLDEFPHDVDILRGETFRKNDEYCSGVGDTWMWSYFYSLSLEEAEKYFKEESVRVQREYLNIN